MAGSHGRMTMRDPNQRERRTDPSPANVRRSAQWRENAVRGRLSGSLTSESDSAVQKNTPPRIGSRSHKLGRYSPYSSRTQSVNPVTTHRRRLNLPPGGLVCVPDFARRAASGRPRRCSIAKCLTPPIARARAESGLEGAAKMCAVDEGVVERDCGDA